MTRNILADYLAEIARIRATGAGTGEMSYYGALAGALNAAGAQLKPKVCGSNAPTRAGAPLIRANATPTINPPNPNPRHARTLVMPAHAGIHDFLPRLPPTVNPPNHHPAPYSAPYSNRGRGLAEEVRHIPPALKSRGVWRTPSTPAPRPVFAPYSAPYQDHQSPVWRTQRPNRRVNHP